VHSGTAARVASARWGASPLNPKSGFETPCSETLVLHLYPPRPKRLEALGAEGSAGMEEAAAPAQAGAPPTAETHAASVERLPVRCGEAHATLIVEGDSFALLDQEGRCIEPWELEAVSGCAHSAGTGPTRDTPSPAGGRSAQPGARCVGSAAPIGRARRWGRCAAQQGDAHGRGGQTGRDRFDADTPRRTRRRCGPPHPQA